MDELVSDARIALGTVQWGLPYGIANRAGQPGSAEVKRMLKLARDEGIDTLDTAQAYGESEAVIGGLIGDDPAFHVVTKTSPELLTGDADGPTSLARLRETLKRSRTLLGRSRLDTVLLHRPEQRLAHDGALWEVLREQRAQGRIGRIGLSALSPADALAGLEDPDVEVMQVASSILDRRLHTMGLFAAAADRGVQLHVRSVFLQGAAFFHPEQLPEPLRGLKPSLRALDDSALRLGVPRPVLFWAWARRLGASRLLVGCESVEQLGEQLGWFRAAGALSDEILAIGESLPELGEDVLDPSRWS